MKHFVGKPSNITSRIYDQLSNLRCKNLGEYRWYEAWLKAFLGWTGFARVSWLEDNLFLNFFFHPIKLFSYDMEALIGVVVLCNDLANYNFLTGRLLERWRDYISFLMSEGDLIQGWVVGPNYFLGIFLRPICFGNNTRLFVPFKMVFKIFKERNIAGCFFHEFFPFCQNFFLLFTGMVGSIGFSLDSIFL